MRNKQILGLAVMMMLVLTMGSVIAQPTEYNQEVYNKMTNFWTKINYALTHGFFLFTSWGQANCCSVNPDEEFWMKKGDRIDCDDFCSYDKCAIDVWYDDALYLNPAYSWLPSGSPDWNNWDDEYHDGYFIAPSNHQYWYVQVYCCPQTCEVEDHSTRAYVCENGEWDKKSNYDIDEYCSHDTSGEGRCWCADEDDNFYVDESGNVHCRSSPRDSWCAPYTEHYEKKCYNNDVYWYDSQGSRGDKYKDCGLEGCSNGVCKTNGNGNGNGDDNGNGNGEIKVSNIILPDRNQPTYKRLPQYDQTFKVTLTNNGNQEGTVNVEAGFYTQTYAQDVAKLFSVFNIFSIVEPIESCHDQEDFVTTKRVTLNPGESETVELKMQPVYSYVTLPPNDYKLSKIKLVSFLGVYEKCCEDKDNDGECDPGTGGYIDFGYDKNWVSHIGTPIIPTKILCGGVQMGQIGSIWEDDFLEITNDYRTCITHKLVFDNNTLSDENEGPCKKKQEFFYTDGSAVSSDWEGFILWKHTSLTGDIINPAKFNNIIPGFSLKYRENKATACCEGLKYIFDDEKTVESSEGVFLFTSKKTTITYSTYKCVEEGEIGFCLEFAHRYLNPYTKVDNCQTNTIIFIIIIVGGFIAISRFAG